MWGRGCSPCHESLSMGVQALLEPIPFPGPLMAWASLVAQHWAPHMLLSSGTPEVCVSSSRQPSKSGPHTEIMAESPRKASRPRHSRGWHLGTLHYH